MARISNPVNFRNNIKNKFNVIIEEAKASSNLEKGIFNYTLKEASVRNLIKKWDNKLFVQIYIDRVRTVYNNLQNMELLTIAKSNQYKIHEIAFMTHQEMKPSLWKDLIEIKQKKDKMKFENSLEASTDTFTCRKCKSKKCTYYAMQCRSADEPMTLFVTCIDCGQRFKTQ
jgi:DNA-directed RNA polymerase subunit M/transcription elongation factor TFIIS